MKYENETFEATVAELRALATYASTDQTRQQLTSVCFDLENARVAATDGHRLIRIDACVSGPARGKGHALVNARELAAAMKGLGGKKAKVRVAFEKDRVTIESGAIKGAFRKVDTVPFPPIDQVTPYPGDMVPARAVGFNANYLADLGVVASIAESIGQGPGCTLRLGSELEPARIDADLLDGGHLTIVLMPMRI